MTLEEKFLIVVAEARYDPVDIYMRSQDGVVRVCVKEGWKDGLGSISAVRIINTTLGLVTAPRDWDHLMRVIELNGLTHQQFSDGMDNVLDRYIRNHHRSITKIRKAFGDEYVDGVIKKFEELDAFAKEVGAKDATNSC